MKKYLLLIAAISFSIVVNAQLTGFAATNESVSRQGRTIVNTQGAIELISSASSVGFQFEGDSCSVSFKNIASPGDYNYLALEIDGEYAGRIRVNGTDMQSFVITPLKKLTCHTLRIFKATEAQNGVVAYYSVRALKLKPLTKNNNLKVEFIGNSITCGMGNDLQQIPCGSEKWYDQHNAYWSYAALTARALEAEFMLSSISGAGIYRNWNSDGPTVPLQYESAYLITDSLRKWDFKTFIPDIVMVALGTNDLSNGDGTKQRLPFDSEIFIREYIKFIGAIYTNYPEAKIILLTSPMIEVKRSETLLMCLETVKTEVTQQYPGSKEIEIFRFTAVPSTGCSGHPTIEEHKMMASQLIPFLREMTQK